MQDGHSVRARPVQASPHCRRERVEAALLTDGDAPSEEGLRQVPQQIPVSHGAHQLGHLARWHHPPQLAQRVGTEDRIDRQAEIALELG